MSPKALIIYVVLFLLRYGKHGASLNMVEKAVLQHEKFEFYRKALMGFTFPFSLD